MYIFDDKVSILKIKYLEIAIKNISKLLPVKSTPFSNIPFGGSTLGSSGFSVANSPSVTSFVSSDPSFSCNRFL